MFFLFRSTPLSSNLNSSSDNLLNSQQVSEFNEAVRKLQVPFYMEFTSPQPDAVHKKIIYKRLTPIGNWDFFRLLHFNWFDSSLKIGGKIITNNMNTDFKLYSTIEDARNDINAWKFCNFNDTAGVGFPRDCGVNAATSKGWISYYPGEKRSSNRPFKWRLIK